MKAVILAAGKGEPGALAKLCFAPASDPTWMSGLEATPGMVST
jgi:hypothetical protein